MLPVTNSHVFQMLFGILGNIIGVGVNLAPVGTFYNIYTNKSTQGFSGLPYVFALSAALLWILYGIPLVTPKSILLLTINSAASVIQICYVGIFLTYGAKNRRRHVIKVMTACFGALAIVTIVTLGIIHHRADRARFVGCLCVVIGIMSYASPLSVARIVIITKSVQFLPIVLCCFLFVNSVVWSCYGIFTKDIYVLIPNGFGAVFGVAQLSLYMIYRNSVPLDPLDPINYKKQNADKPHQGKKKVLGGEESRRGTKGTGAKAKDTKMAKGDGVKDGENGAAAKVDIKHGGNGHLANGKGKLDGHHVDVYPKDQPAEKGDYVKNKEDTLSLPGHIGNQPSLDSPNSTPLSISSPINLSYTVIVINQDMGNQPA